MGYLVALAVLLAAVAAWQLLNGAKKTRRRRVYERLAGELGYEHVAEPADTEEVRDDEKRIRMGLETGLVCEEHIRGEVDGLTVDIFDEVQSQIVCSASLTAQTVIEIGSGSQSTPEFILQPECRLTRIVHNVDGNWGLRVGGDVAFAAHNYVRTEDEDGVRQLLTEAARRPLRDNQRIWIQGTGTAYRFYIQGQRLSAKQTTALLDLALDLARAFRGARSAEPA